MTSEGLTKLNQVLRRDTAGLLADWGAQQASLNGRSAGMSGADLRERSREFVAVFIESAGRGSLDTDGVAWSPMRDLLGDLSRSQTLAGASPSEIAGFVLSFKRPLFERIRSAYAAKAEDLAEVMWVATDLIDSLALYTTEVFQKSREEVIARQQADMLELSTPVVKLWDGVLALPMIGTLDSGRTQVVMEQLLQRIVETGAEIAILDITGVPTVDTLVAQHLLKTVTAARLMGADCIISGIRPQIAQTIVHLGVDLKDVITKATMADAFALALRRRNLRVTSAAKTSEPPSSASRSMPT